MASTHFYVPGLWHHHLYHTKKTEKKYIIKNPRLCDTHKYFNVPRILADSSD